MKIETTKTIAYILGVMIALASTIIAVDKYFAKSVTVEKLTERVDIGITDDQIFQQEQRVRMWEAELQFKKRTEPPTKIEERIIMQEKEVLYELQKQRLEKIQGYRDRRK